MAQKAGHRHRWALILTSALAVALSCTEDIVDEGYVPARPGAIQPAPGGGAVDEQEACQRIRDAEEAAREDLQCQSLERPLCPFYIRPAGSGCWEYSEDSVAACETAIAGYDDCLDFSDTPCVVSASLSDPDCPVAPIIGGAGGMSAGGAGGEGVVPVGGAPPSAGSGGVDAGGAGGAGGAAGAPGGAAGAGGAAAGAGGTMAGAGGV